MPNKHSLSLDLINMFLQNDNIFVSQFLDNTKASEFYVRTKFIQDDGFEWDTIVPYEYRRTGLKIDTEEGIADYLRSVKKYFTREWMESWVAGEKQKCLDEIAEKEKKNADKVSRGKKPTEIVTPYVLLPLFSLKECDNQKDLPDNRNLQRRLQDLKDGGYTIPIVQYGQTKTTSTLLPFPKHTEMGYENFAQIRSRIIRLLKFRNAFEAKPTSPKSLIPDHKFSEVRWDDATKAENSMEMTDDEIIQKFQLLDNQRNEQKREVCRKCFQEGVRGSIYGIDFYYKGDENWDDSIPKIGKAAEEGCVGCPWYDIERWRQELMKKVKE